MKMHVAEVSYDKRIDEYEVIANDSIQARDLTVMHLSGTTPRWKSIRVRETPQESSGPARVVGKKSE